MKSNQFDDQCRRQKYIRNDIEYKEQYWIEMREWDDRQQIAEKDRNVNESAKILREN